MRLGLEGGRQAAPEGFLELEWAPGAAQVDFGSFRCVLAGVRTDMRLLVVTLPHSNARYCAATCGERSECPCDGLARIFEWVGRAPATLVLDDAAEAGGTVRDEVTESRLFSRPGAHRRCQGRHRDPCCGNERGSVESAVGFLRRSLLVPEPSAPSPAAPDVCIQ